MQVSSYLPTLLKPLRDSELHMRSGQNGEKPWETSDLGKRQPLNLILFSFSATRILSLLCSILSVSHFLTPPPVHSVLSFSFPHSTGDGRQNGSGNCGSETYGEPAMRGLPLLWIMENTSSSGGFDPQRRPLINFMATSEGALVFLKEIDGTKEYKDKYYISKFLMNVIKENGPEKVFQVINDNAYMMKAARSLIDAEMKLIKRSLQSMVISEQWTSYKEDDVGKATRVRDIILDDLWWDRVDYIILFTSPIYDMLRAADTDRPTLHLVYDMWITIIEKVKAIIFRHEGKQEGEVSTFYNVMYDILIDRWTKNCTTLHCMAHSLNPKYYSTEWLELSANRVPPHQDLEISEERNKCLERFFLDDHERKLAKTEFGKFSRGIIGGKIHVAMVKDRSEIDAIDWWCCYGAYFPKLQSIASKLLVQPCSSSCCDSWEDPYGGAEMLEIASLTLDEPELEEEIMGATSETVSSSAPDDSESVGDEDDQEDVVLG
uniref:DUF659 domain-containing protein n=1 Tax=Fagus sylvatica TaxID=28930 RepID=A0A2N9IJE4_FAGSY